MKIKKYIYIFIERDTKEVTLGIIALFDNYTHDTSLAKGENRLHYNTYTNRVYSKYHVDTTSHVGI